MENSIPAFRLLRLLLSYHTFRNVYQHASPELKQKITLGISPMPAYRSCTRKGVFLGTPIELTDE